MFRRVSSEHLAVPASSPAAWEVSLKGAPLVPLNRCGVAIVPHCLWPEIDPSPPAGMYKDPSWACSLAAEYLVNARQSWASMATQTAACGME